jgi:hypothetical protein
MGDTAKEPASTGALASSSVAMSRQWRLSSGIMTTTSLAASTADRRGAAWTRGDQRRAEPLQYVTVTVIVSEYVVAAAFGAAFWLAALSGIWPYAV